MRRTMNYRSVLYSTYVSANKRYLYETVADERARERHLRSAVWSLRSWLPPKEAGPRVVDLACGPGNLLAVFERVGYADFTGVDASAEQVAVARSVFPSVVEDDVFAFLSRDESGSYDLITAFDLIEHFTRDEAIEFLRLVHQRLRPGGALILQMPNGDSPFAGAVYSSDATHETLYTSVSLRHMLQACGFGDCEFREYGPAPMSAAGVVRYGLWRLVRAGIKALHYIETGAPSTGIYTRTFRCRVIRP
jgi:2-polyprenyl-3-methyl-5-hydroxy-6-metoxy-1,4-benzoquinol methylase